MDDRDLHDDDMADGDDLENDDSDTENTDDESDDSKKADAEVVRKQQREAWLKKIKDGKASLDDMPKNLEWLKKDIQKDLGGEVKEDELELKIRNVLSEREAKHEFDFLVEDLQGANISEEQEAQLREEYESLIAEFQNPTESQKLKSLMVARRLAGLKDTSSELRDRRRKGMSLPPLGGRKRSTVQKDSMSEIEKRLSGGLPPGFQA